MSPRPVLSICLTPVVQRVIPFVVIALLLEEVIPIIAIYAPSLLPSTCILPSQQERIQQKKSQKAFAFAVNYSLLFSQLKSMESPENYLPINTIRILNAPLAISGSAFSIFIILRFSSLHFYQASLFAHLWFRHTTDIPNSTPPRFSR